MRANSDTLIMKEIFIVPHLRANLIPKLAGNPEKIRVIFAIRVVTTLSLGIVTILFTISQNYRIVPQTQIFADRVALSKVCLG